jgi:hypothetical protein
MDMKHASSIDFYLVVILGLLPRRCPIPHAWVAHSGIPRRRAQGWRQPRAAAEFLCRAWAFCEVPRHSAKLSWAKWDKDLSACALARSPLFGDDPLTNRRKIGDQRRTVAEDAATLTGPWCSRTPAALSRSGASGRLGASLCFAPTIAAALSVRHHFLWVL